MIHGAEGEGPSIYIADPEGNAVELKGRRGEDFQMTEAASGMRSPMSDS